MGGRLVGWGVLGGGGREGGALKVTEGGEGGAFWWGGCERTYSKLVDVKKTERQ